MSALEDTLAFQLKALEIAQPVREWQFARERRFRFDFAWPAVKLAAEVEGGIFAGGAHTRGARFRRDTIKYNMAAELGWTVLRYTDDQIHNGAAALQIERVLQARAVPA